MLRYKQIGFSRKLFKISVGVFFSVAQRNRLFRRPWNSDSVLFLENYRWCVAFFKTRIFAVHELGDDSQFERHILSHRATKSLPQFIVVFFFLLLYFFFQKEFCFFFGIPATKTHKLSYQRCGKFFGNRESFGSPFRRPPNGVDVSNGLSSWVKTPRLTCTVHVFGCLLGVFKKP